MEDIDIPVAGYILYFVHTFENGTKQTMTRFVQVEDMELVRKFVDDHGIFIQQDRVDEFLNKLKLAN